MRLTATSVIHYQCSMSTNSCHLCGNVVNNILQCTMMVIILSFLYSQTNGSPCKCLFCSDCIQKHFHEDIYDLVVACIPIDLGRNESNLLIYAIVAEVFVNAQNVNRKEKQNLKNQRLSLLSLNSKNQYILVYY